MYPVHCKRAVPFGIALRIKRNCSTDDFLQNRCKEYKAYLKSQNYPAELVDKQFDKALSIPRAELLRRKVKPAKKKKFHWSSTTIQFCGTSKKLLKSTFIYYNPHQKSKKFFHPSRYLPLIVEPKFSSRRWRHQNFG